MIYESNILIVVKQTDIKTIEKIIKIKSTIEKIYRGKISINPYIAKQGEEIIEKFKNIARYSKEKTYKNLEVKALEEFKAELEKLDFISEIIIPKEEIYESNIIVVIDEIDFEKIKKIIQTKLKIENRYGGKISISPYIAKQGEEIVESLKKTIRGSS